MADKKQLAVALLRRSRLLRLVDYGRYRWNLQRHQHDNRRFLREHPGFAVPPPDLAYDAYGDTNWRDYYRTGREHARYIAQVVERYVAGDTVTLAEWGCGPARVLRHLPEFLAAIRAHCHGFDYNQRSIGWCRQHINGITFTANGLAPPLPCAAATFDFLYCLSVITHLSLAHNVQWLAELSRVVRPGGYILFTTHGDAFRDVLLPAERRRYDSGEAVVRDKIEEGKRCFVTFLPPAFVKNELLGGLELVFHRVEPISPTFRQDVWLVRTPPA